MTVYDRETLEIVRMAHEKQGHSLREHVMGFIARIRNAIERRRAYAQLVRLDDRMLADIGLTRGSIRERLYSEPAAALAGSPAFNRVLGTEVATKTAANEIGRRRLAA